MRAERFAFACGPWLPKLFPQLLGSRIFPTRQEVFFFAPPAGDQRFQPGQLPGWADFNDGDIYYGFPTWKGAASRSHTTSTARRSIRIAATGSFPPVPSPKCAST